MLMLRVLVWVGTWHGLLIPLPSALVNFMCCGFSFEHMAYGCSFVMLGVITWLLSCLFLCATCSPVCLTPPLNWQRVRELKILLLLKVSIKTGIHYIDLQSERVNGSQSVEYDGHRLFSFRVRFHPAGGVQTL